MRPGKICRNMLQKNEARWEVVRVVDNLRCLTEHEGLSKEFEYENIDKKLV